MAKKKTNKTKVTPATKKVSKPVVKNEDKKEEAKKPATDNKSKVTTKAPVVKKKRTALKATLITLAAVLGAGALGVGGYYVWNHFEISPAQPAVDKDIQAVVYMMNALNENSTKADFDAVDEAYKALTVKQQERLEENDAFYRYARQKVLYENDSKLVNEFFNRTKELVPETCSTVDITNARKLKEEVKAINRGEDFESKIIEALGYLNAAEAKYSVDEQLVNKLVAKVSTPDFIKSANNEDLNGVKEILEDAKIANQSRQDADFAKKIVDAEAKIEAADESHKIDAAKIEKIKAKVEELKSKIDECTTDEIANVEKEYKAAIDSIHDKRLIDFGNDINTMKATIEETKKKYDADAAIVNEFIGLVDKLDSTSSDNVIKTAEGKVEAAKAIKRADLKEKVAKASELLEKCRSDYDKEAEVANEFIKAINTLSGITSPTQVDIDEAAELKEDALKIKRTNLVDGISAAVGTLKEIQDAYDADAKIAHEFTDLVDRLDNTSSDADIKAAKSKEEAAQEIARTDLAKEVDDAAEALAEHRAQYDIDAAAAKQFTDAVAPLGPTSSKSAIDAAAAFEQNAQNVVRKDLTAAVDLASAKLKGLQDAYYAGAEIAHAFTNLATKLDDTSSIDEIEAAKSKQSAAEKVTQEDLADEVDDASEKLKEQEDKYAEDKTKADDFTNAVKDLDSTSPKSAIDAAAAFEEDAQNVQRKDLTAAVDAASEKLSAIQTAYNDDVVSAKAVTDIIDTYYSESIKHITEDNITDLNTAYLALNTRAKSIANATCAGDHGGLDVPSVITKMSTEYADGAPVNTLIEGLSSSITDYDTDASKYRLLSIIRQYNAIYADTTDHPFALKAITEVNQNKIKTLREAIDVERAYTSNLNGPEVDGDVSYDFNDTYGDIASVKGGEPQSGGQFAAFMTISAEEATALKARYDEIHFYFSVSESPYSTTTPSLHVYSSSNQIGYLDPVPERNTFYKITLHMDQAIDGFPIIFKIAAAVGATITVTNLYGIPKA